MICEALAQGKIEILCTRHRFTDTDTMPMAIHASTLVSTPVLAAYGAASVAALAAVLLKAGLEQPDFLAAAAWISNNNGCFLVILNFLGYALLLTGRIMQLVLFGKLQRSEEERFNEQLWYQLFDMFFTLTLFPIDFDLRYVLLASVLKFFQLFHNLCGIRIEQMGQMPVLPRAFHIRMIALLMWLGTSDSSLVLLNLAITSQHFGPGSFMVYMSSIAILQLIQWGALISKYSCECYELGLEEPWHSKSRYVFFIELVSDLLMFLTYPLCYGLFIYFNSNFVAFFLPFSATRDFLLLGYSLFKKVRELLRFRAATRDMETRYPSLTEEELQALQDRTCIICREELVVSGVGSNHNNTPKRLACTHVFHFRCLHSWLERQQSCPTCRRSVLEPTNPPAPAQDVQQNAQQNAQQEPEPAPGPHRPQSSLEGLLARFNRPVPRPSTDSARETATDPALSMSPSDAARSLLDNPRLDPRQVHGARDPAWTQTKTAEAGQSRDASSLPRPSDHVNPVPQATTSAESDEKAEQAPEDPREAVRRATLARFAKQSSEGATADSAFVPPVSSAGPQGSSEDPALIPLFDPAADADMELERTAVTLPGPGPTQAHTSTSESPAIDTQLREQLRLLQETQAALQQSIARLSEALRLSEEKGKSRATSEPT